MNERQVTRLNIAGFAVFCLAYLAVKLVAVSAAHYDYAKEIYNAQALRWFYEAANPPLYTWLLHGLIQITGPGVKATLVLTHALLFLVLLVAFALGRGLLGSATDGALAAWLLLTVHQVFRLQFARTHRLLLVLFALLAVLVFVGLLRQRRTRDYVLLGLVLGAGLLSKFTFAGFIGALILGALVTREGRRALATPRLALTIVALLAVTLPAALAGLDQWTALAEIFKMKTSPTTPSGGLPAPLAALLGLAGAVAAFAAVPVLAMGAAGVGGRLRRPAGGDEASARGPAGFDTGALRLLVTVMVAGLAILIVSVLAGAIGRARLCARGHHHPRCRHCRQSCRSASGIGCHGSRPARDRPAASTEPRPLPHRLGRRCEGRRCEGGAAAMRPPASLINASGLAWADALGRARVIAVPWRWVSRDRFRPFAEGRRRTSSWGIILLHRGEGVRR